MCRAHFLHFHHSSCGLSSSSTFSASWREEGRGGEGKREEERGGEREREREGEGRGEGRGGEMKVEGGRGLVGRGGD